MELFTAQAVSNLPCRSKLFASSPILSTVRSKPSLALGLPLISIPTRRLVYFSSRLLRAVPENGPNKYVDDERSGGVTLEDVKPVKDNDYMENVKPEVINLGDTAANGETQTFEFLDDLNLDFDNSYSVYLLYGVGGLAALYLASAVVGAIDSIPLFPKLMEVVGLSYSLWFSYRYLLFKNNRDELAAKIKDLKQQVTGSKHD